MGPNKAEQGVDNALVNRINALEAQLLDIRTKPQPIGNGSLNYASTGTNIAFSGVTINAGSQQNFSITLFPTGTNITFNGLPAINRVTFVQMFWTVAVDTNAPAYYFPNGSSLTAGQRNFTLGAWNDLANSAFSEASGQTLTYLQIKNNDSAAHTYYVQANYIIPRPALKSQ